MLILSFFYKRRIYYAETVKNTFEIVFFLALSDKITIRLGPPGRKINQEEM